MENKGEYMTERKFENLKRIKVAVIVAEKYKETVNQRLERQRKLTELGLVLTGLIRKTKDKK